MITIVSGLPRSGTSLTMQMLEAGGFPVFYDILNPDQHNPKGYREWTGAARLWEDTPGKLSLIEGKCVKIFPAAWPMLTGDYQYQFIYIDRPMDQIVASQTAMRGCSTYLYGLERSKFQALSFIKAFQHLIIPHGLFYTEGRLAATALYDFLSPSGQSRDEKIERMVGCIDNSLRHH